MTITPKPETLASDPLGRHQPNQKQKSKMSDYSTHVGTTQITIRADFGQASDQICIRYSDCGEQADFRSSGKQVADFRHSPKSALKYFREEMDNE